LERRAQTKAKPEAKAAPPAKEAGPVAGFAVAPMVLQTYGCVDTTATGLFTGVSTDRKDLAVEKGDVVYFRRVLLKFDAERTKVAADNTAINRPPAQFYEGWIPDENFYAVSPEQFDKMLAEKKIPLKIKQGR
jgi:hypothetical protein